MKKTLVVLVFAMMLALVACGGDNGSSAHAVDLLQVKDNMLAADASIPNMSLASGKDENAADLFSYLADFDYGKVDDYFFSYASAGTAEEIAVVRVKDSKDAKALTEALTAHINTRVKQFETYDPSQVDMSKSGIVLTNENYCVLIICADKEAVKKAFYDAINEEK